MHSKCVMWLSSKKSNINYVYAKKDEGEIPSHSSTPALLFHFLFCYNYFQVMRQYNEGLLTKQDRCKHFIMRQLEILEKNVTEEEVNEMVATGNWEVFNENLLNDVRITRSQLSEIEQRHRVRAKTTQKGSWSLGKCFFKKLYSLNS